MGRYHLLLTVTEGALGAVFAWNSALRQKVDLHASPIEALHLTNTLLLVAALTLTAHLLSRRAGYSRGKVRLVAPLGAIVSLVAILVVAASGLSWLR